VQVTDACSSDGVAETTADGDPFDSELEAGDFGGQPELPGECDMVVKVQPAPLPDCRSCAPKHTGNKLLRASTASTTHLYDLSGMPPKKRSHC
jgi:hypothetical protein